MCEKYGIDDKTRFLVLLLDAQLKGPEISRIINKTMRTVQRWIRKTRNGEDIRIHKKRKGRKKAITEEIEEKIIRMVKENPESATSTKIAARFGISSRSVQRILSKKGFKYRVFDRTIIYDEDERSFRVEFCKKMLSDEGNLIFRAFYSDEMGIELNNARGLRAWQTPTEKIRRKAILENVKLDCWGAISAQGATSLDIYKKGMNGELYRQVIERHKEEMERFYPDGEFYLIQDNHPSHRMNEEWIVQEQNLHLIKLPRRSPDLNIIEHLWLALKERVAGDAPTNEKELSASLVKNWEILTKPDRLQPFFETLQSRYMECIVKGGLKLPT